MNTLAAPRRKLLVAAPTYKRNDMLEILLNSLNELEIPADTDVEVVIIDNDEAEGARATVAGCQSRFSLPLHYETERAPGVTHVRNKALDLAADFDLLAFIDDDEYAHPRWLVALVARYDSTRAAAVFGPVDPVYADNAPRWMRSSKIHGVEVSSDDDRTTPGASGNCLLDMTVVNSTGMRFDTRMSSLGGEDTMMFTRFLDGGHRLAQASDALVFEPVPEARATTGWVMRRWYRTGMTDALIAGRDMSPGKARLRALIHGVLRVGAGSLLMALTAVITFGNVRQIMARCYTVCRGAGMISFALGKQYEEYGRGATSAAG